MREAYRLQKASLQNELKERGKYLAVFIIYTGKDLPPYTMVADKMAMVLQRMAEIIRETPAA